MGRGKPWADEENSLLLDMVAEELSPQAIFDPGRFPDRTVDAVRMQVQRLGTYVQTTRKTFVQTIEPAKDALSMEEVVKPFSTASSLFIIAYLILSLGYGIINVRFENFLR
jgi:hypothetical protein